MTYISFLWLSPTLTQLGKRFGIDAHYFAKNSFFVLVSHSVSVIRGFISGYLVARLFPQEIYGEYQFILSVMSILGVFGIGGLVTSVMRAWARGDAFSLRRITIYQLCVSLIGSAILLGSIPFLHLYGRENLWPLFLAGAIIFPLPNIAQVHFGAPTVGLGRFDIALKANVIWSVIMIAVTTWIILVHPSSLLMLLAGTVIPPIVYLAMSRSMRPPVEQGDATTRAIIRYGWQLSITTLPSDIVWYLDKILISHYLGLNQLATFSVALLIPEQAKVFLKQFLPVAFARQAAGEDTRERRQKLTKVVLLGIVIFAIGVALYIALCPLVIHFLFPQYDAAQVTLLTSIAAATLVIMPMNLYAQYLEARRMVREVQWTNWSAAAVFAVALVTLIPSYGLVGAMIARGLFRATYLGTSWWFVMRSPLERRA